MKESTEYLLKEAQLHKFDLAKIPRAWKKMTGSPLGSALALGGGAALGTYFLAPWALRKGYGLVRGALPAKARMEIERELATKMPAMRWKTTAAMGGLAAALSLANNWNLKYPWKSLAKWDYADEPKTAKRDDAAVATT